MPTSKVCVRFGWATLLAHFHLAAEAGEQPFLPAGLFRRQHLQGEQPRRPAVAGQVDGAHAAFADRHDDLVRAEDEAGGRAVEQLAGLEMREPAEADEVVGQLLGSVRAAAGADATTLSHRLTAAAGRSARRPGGTARPPCPIELPAMYSIEMGAVGRDKAGVVCQCGSVVRPFTDDGIQPRPLTADTTLTLDLPDPGEPDTLALAPREAVYEGDARPVRPRGGTAPIPDHAARQRRRRRRCRQPGAVRHAGRAGPRSPRLPDPCPHGPRRQPADLPGERLRRFGRVARPSMPRRRCST